jgi:WD40 repeat protein
VQHCEDQEGIKAGCNCAEVKLEQEIKNDIVVQSLAAKLGDGLILTGDRMGNIKLWRGGKNMLGSNKAWTCERTFSSKMKKGLALIDEAMNFSITTLTFLSDDIFATGTRGGSLRLWTVESEKDLVSINGAHNDAIVDIKLGCVEQKRKSTDKSLVFASASADGKVLTFSVNFIKNEKCKPFCLSISNHSITSRYFSNREAQSVGALECIEIPNTGSCDLRKAIVSTSSGGDINILKTNLSPTVEHQDAMLLHRQHMENEALTLHALASALLNGVEVKDRKRKMLKCKQCFLGRSVSTCIAGYRHNPSSFSLLFLAIF